MDLPAGRERRAQEGSDASGQTLRVSAAQSPLRPLHPGSGLQDHRHPGEGPAGGLQGLRRYRRQGQGRHHHVRHGLDPAHRRCAEHPRHVHHPDAARQHGGGGRRRERSARGVQRPGLHRPRAAVPHPARLYRNPGHQLAEARGLPETPAQEQRPAERQLVAERAQVHGQPAQGLLRRCRHGGQRVRLPVDAQARCRQGLQLARSLRRHVQWGDQRVLRLGHEPGLQRGERQQNPRGHEEPGLAGERQPLRQRDRIVLARPRHGPRQDQDRGVHAAGLRLGRKGGQRQQQRPLDAVALSGAETPGRKPPGRRHHSGPGQQAQGALQERGWGLPRSYSRPEMGLCRLPR